MSPGAEMSILCFARILVVFLIANVVVSFSFNASPRSPPLARKHGWMQSSSMSLSSWSSAISINNDLVESIEEVSASAAIDKDVSSFNVAIFFVSSIYEQASYSYTSIFDGLKKKFPSLKIVLGCTAGSLVGPLKPFDEPVEVESRASLALMLAHFDDDVSTTTFRLDPDDISSYLSNGKLSVDKLPQSLTSDSVTFLFATENAKSNLADLVTKLRVDTQSSVFGAVASSVTALQMPKLFLYEDGSLTSSEFEKFNTGVVGLVLSGNVCVQTVAARSCLPVGPIFDVTESKGTEIFALKVSKLISRYVASYFESLDFLCTT